MSAFYKIESGIPLPSLAEGQVTNYGPVRLAMRQLQPGDSFLFPNNKLQTVQIAAKAEKMKVATRKVDATTRRVWRVQ